MSNNPPGCGGRVQNFFEVSKQLLSVVKFLKCCCQTVKMSADDIAFFKNHIVEYVIPPMILLIRLLSFKNHIVEYVITP